MTQDLPLRALLQQGRDAHRAGRLDQALALLYQAAQRTSARENEYLPVVEELRRVYARIEDARAMLTLDWYRGSWQEASTLLQAVPPYDRARTLQAFAEQEKKPARFAEAAATFESVGLGAHAAICRERAGDVAAARTLWSRLAHALSGREADVYPAALARFNLARACKATGDASAGLAAVVSSVHLLEEAADRYEREGQRERAFDCYQVLIAIGKHMGQFEHVLEGYVNAIRILREDALRYYAIQSYEEVLESAQQNGELAAGATLAQELAGYAQAQSLAQVASFATRLGAKLWEQVAKTALERGAPAEMAENSLLAAIVASARQRQFTQVGRLYADLARLDGLEPARRRHYERASKRYAGAPDQAIDASPLPAHLRQDAAFPDVWHVDLIEWEQRGSASAACGDVVLDFSSWSEITRKRAMLARLVALQAERSQPPLPAELSQLADALAQVELYGILSPLEHLYRHDVPTVRLAVVRALERFMYKRTFVTVRDALGDADTAVRQQACRTLEALRFPHAFDPLARIFREASDPAARAAAIAAIARIDTTEAAELLLGVFQHEGQHERAAAAEGLKRARGGVFVELARQSLATLAPAAQQAVRDVLHARGEMI